MKGYISKIKIDAGLPQPVYVQLSNGFIQLIRSGILKPGSRLPSIRESAKQFNLHAKTIVAAYQEMEIQGWLITRPRSGVMVAENLPDLKPRAFSPPAIFKEIAEDEPEENKKKSAFKYVINDGFPDYRLAPIEQLLKCYKNAFYSGLTEKFSMFIDPAGSLRLRVALAKYVGESRALQIDYKNILVTKGAQMATFIAANVIIKPGDVVFVGEPGYATATRTFEYMGAKVVRIPVDANGINVDLLEEYCRTNKCPKILYIIPHHHHPTTVVLTADRRMKLLSLIEEYKFYVIEDDYDYEFHYAHSPVLPLASADHTGRVLYIGSITKNMSTSIRVGYLVASEKIISESLEYKRLMDVRGDMLMEDALATLYENGTMQRHIKKSLKLYRERRDLMCDLLKEKLGNKISFKIPDGGMAVWVQFNKPYDLPKIAAAAAKKGLLMRDGSFYNHNDINYNSLRIGFASLNTSEITSVINILGEVMKHDV